MSWSCTDVSKDKVEEWGDEMAPAFDDWIYEPGPSKHDLSFATDLDQAGIDIDSYIIDQDNIYMYDETAKPKDLNTLLNEFARCGY